MANRAIRAYHTYALQLYTGFCLPPFPSHGYHHMLGLHANEKEKRQVEREEWEEIVKCRPVDASKEKQAFDLALSLPKKKGHVDYAAAGEGLIYQGWPFSKCKIKFANQI